jgi:hypothetical protein
VGFVRISSIVRTTGSKKDGTSVRERMVRKYLRGRIFHRKEIQRGICHIESNSESLMCPSLHNAIPPRYQNIRPCPRFSSLQHRRRISGWLIDGTRTCLYSRVSPVTFEFYLSIGFRLPDLLSNSIYATVSKSFWCGWIVQRMVHAGWPDHTKIYSHPRTIPLRMLSGHFPALPRTFAGRQDLWNGSAGQGLARKPHRSRHAFTCVCANSLGENSPPGGSLICL